MKHKYSSITSVEIIADPMPCMTQLIQDKIDELENRVCYFIYFTKINGKNLFDNLTNLMKVLKLSDLSKLINLQRYIGYIKT